MWLAQKDFLSVKVDLMILAKITKPQKMLWSLISFLAKDFMSGKIFSKLKICRQ